jgi:cytidylate kinase
LRPALDAILLDTSALTPEQAIAEAIRLTEMQVTA